MKRAQWITLGPSFLLACGIVAATWVAAHAGSPGVQMLGGTVVLSLATLVADAWGRRLKGRSSWPSWAALILVVGFAGASAILISGDAGSLRTMIPTFGIVAWMMLLSRPEAKRLDCPAMSHRGERS